MSDAPRPGPPPGAPGTRDTSDLEAAVDALGAVPSDDPAAVLEAGERVHERLQQHLRAVDGR